MSKLKKERFLDVDLGDEFFNSLREDYPGFNEWFGRKAADGADAYVFRSDGGSVEGFLYLKVEDDAVDDVSPALPAMKRLKIGTFKVDPHGTRLGERLMKKAFDHAMAESIDELYVTIFPKHGPLVELLTKYGFAKAAEKDGAGDGPEDVLVRSLRTVRGDVVADYPLVSTAGRSKYILSIYPKYHTALFPDSKLHNEPPDIVADVSHTNSIHKIYLTRMQGTEGLQPGDILVSYRTSDGKGPAHYRSVVTSVCVVEEACDISSFGSEREFLEKCDPYSVFAQNELRRFWASKQYPTIIRFTYNAALKKRITRGDLIDRDVIDPKAYAGFMPLNDEQFLKIVQLGGVDEGLIVHPS